MLRSSCLLFALVSVLGCGQDGTQMPPPGNPPPNNPPPPPQNGIQLASPAFTLNPGDEVFKCWFTSIASDTDIAAVKFSSEMTPGSHHFIVFTTAQAQRPDGTFEDCQGVGGTGINDTPVWLYAAQDPHNELNMPAGVAMPLKAHQPLIFNMHYLNTTQSPMTVQVWVNLDYATGGYQKAGAFVTFNTMISIPPGGTQTVGGNCSVPAGIKFFTMSTHSHKRTTDAMAARYLNGQVGEVLVNTTDWEHATVSKWGDPYLTLAPGEQIHYECSYRNTTTQTITVGESANTNEMCMAVGYYFPATANSFCLNSYSFQR
ncbi:MAG TPA: hypothetical protein VKN99_08050 [Polyangia bacterium]|nr:hypothetical protein [Polyangia bacterium]